jgi:hypothetical protein
VAKTESHLDEALRRCRRINLVELEPDILLELARLRAGVTGSGLQVSKVPGTLEVPGTSEALSLAHEALSIADRCEYRLAQADCHNFLAQLALALSEVEGLEANNLDEAREHAECDSPSHRYEVAFQLAERLLGEIEQTVKRNA